MHANLSLLHITAGNESENQSTKIQHEDSETLYKSE